MWKWLWSTIGFIPRSHCGVAFTETLIVNSKFANLIIFFTYVSIPFTLLVLWLKRRKSIPKPFIMLLFSHFIFFCGLTHLNNFLAFTWPAYRYFILIEDLTALFSLITAVTLPFVVHYLLSLPSFEELRILNMKITDCHQHAMLELELRRQVEADCQAHNELLKIKLAELESQLTNKNWIGERYNALEELKRMLEK